MTLVLVHHAGGSAASFVPFARLLPASWRLLAVDLPGRFYAPAEGRCRSSDEAVDHLSSTLSAELTTPYAIFGHSMGALLAYELARRHDTDDVGPCWLGISGCPAPRAFSTAWAALRGTDGAADRLLRLPRPAGDGIEGGTGRGVGADGADRFGDRIRSVLRDDLLIVENYKFVTGPPLRAGMSVFRAEDDPLTSAENVLDWSRHAELGVRFHTLPGGHFYLFDSPAEVCGWIVRDCRSSWSLSVSRRSAASRWSIAA